MRKIRDEVAKDVGLIIRCHRQKEGISQYELAQRVGTSRTYLNLIENQKKIPSFLLFKEIASQFGKTTAELEIEARSENYGELLVLRAAAAVKKVIQGGDKEKQQKLIEFIESLIGRDK